MRILGNGNVGIGTTSPSAKLSILQSHSSGTSQEMFRIGFDQNWSLRLNQNYKRRSHEI